MNRFIRNIAFALLCVCLPCCLTLTNKSLRESNFKSVLREGYSELMTITDGMKSEGHDVFIGTDGDGIVDELLSSYYVAAAASSIVYADKSLLRDAKGESAIKSAALGLAEEKGARYVYVRIRNDDKNKIYLESVQYDVFFFFRMTAEMIENVWPGVLVRDVEPKERVSLQTNYGAYVSVVYKNSPCMMAGLKAGDVVVSFNSSKVTDSESLLQFLSFVPKGETVRLGIIRGGESMTVELRLS